MPASSYDKAGIPVLRNLQMAMCQAALFQILLMVFFGTPEFGRRNDLSDDRALEAS
jgi:hypothetical protein